MILCYYCWSKTILITFLICCFWGVTCVLWRTKLVIMHFREVCHNNSPKEVVFCSLEFVFCLVNQLLLWDFQLTKGVYMTFGVPKVFFSPSHQIMLEYVVFTVTCNSGRWRMTGRQEGAERVCVRLSAFVTHSYERLSVFVCCCLVFCRTRRV